MLTRMIERDAGLAMTAGFYARAVAAILGNPETTTAERERIIDEIRKMAQACADAGVAPFLKSEDLRDGQQ